MKIIRKNYLVPPNFKAINWFGYLCTKEKARLTPLFINHEEIHSAQMKELLYVPFYLIYGLEWLIRLMAYTVRFAGRWLRDRARKMNTHLAYKKISFEQEAYAHEDNLTYLQTRKRFAFIKHI